MPPSSPSLLDLHHVVRLVGEDVAGRDPVLGVVLLDDDGVVAVDGLGALGRVRPSSESSSNSRSRKSSRSQNSPKSPSASTTHLSPTSGRVRNAGGCSQNASSALNQRSPSTPRISIDPVSSKSEVPVQSPSVDSWRSMRSPLAVRRHVARDRAVTRAHPWPRWPPRRCRRRTRRRSRSSRRHSSSLPHPVIVAATAIPMAYVASLLRFMCPPRIRREGKHTTVTSRCACPDHRRPAPGTQVSPAGRQVGDLVGTGAGSTSSSVVEARERDRAAVVAFRVGSSPRRAARRRGVRRAPSSASSCSMTRRHRHRGTGAA